MRVCGWHRCVCVCVLWLLAHATTQGHARLMARHWVLKQDAVVAVFLVHASTTDGGVQRLAGGPGTTFADDPDAEYQQLVRVVCCPCCDDVHVQEAGVMALMLSGFDGAQQGGDVHITCEFS